jgi:L-alanine-DL-glutamate epimerase-like enolase superfamily enzyme
MPGNPAHSGGITEFKKIASMCETHYVGMIRILRARCLLLPLFM